MKIKSSPFRNIFLVLTFSALVFFSFNLALVKYVNYSGQKEIRQVGDKISTDNSGLLSTVDRIVDWEENQIIRRGNITYQKLHFLNFYVLPKPPFIHMRVSDPSWIMFFKRSACYEFASLFEKIGESAGLEKVRMVRGLGLDHVWNEVKTENGWIHVDPSKTDPTTGERGIIRDPSFYERDSSENGEGDNLLFVYVKDGAEKAGIERTEKYIKESKLSRVVVSVTEDNNPLQNVQATISKGNETSSPFFTDKNGNCVFSLTENRKYEITVERGWGIGHKETREVYVTENTTVSMSPSNLALRPPFKVASAYFIIVFILFLPSLLGLFLINRFCRGIISEAFRKYKFELSGSSIAGFFLITIGLFYVFVLGIGLVEGITLFQWLFSSSLGKVNPIWISIVLMGWIVLCSAGAKWSFNEVQKINKGQNVSFRSSFKVFGSGVIFCMLYGGFVLGTQILILPICAMVSLLILRATNKT